jgi:hypothetical protein
MLAGLYPHSTKSAAAYEIKEWKQKIEILKEENFRKEAFIEKLRKEHMADIATAEEKIKTLSHQKQMLEAKMDVELKE